MRDDNKIKLGAKGYREPDNSPKKDSRNSLFPFLLLFYSPHLCSAYCIHPQLPSRISCLSFSSLSGKFLPPLNTFPFLSTCTFSPNLKSLLPLSFSSFCLLFDPGKSAKNRTGRKLIRQEGVGGCNQRVLSHLRWKRRQTAWNLRRNDEEGRVTRKETCDAK